ncbi:MFS transporter [Sphaerisporangium krabiense]|uniref:MFS family permease n=1 Tax=Sphaerisporangium krabiense TaxID=763782 RepID=A0A7W9DSW6_9ACTN|nr:MFS transporter [Sphaerisporangium krabiense]MBB5630157.1 MFS family permease [Sphaerisporangium krabiense]GII65108.1 MFS transporter [Sphaerisporangium krabiense]
MSTDAEIGHSAHEAPVTGMARYLRLAATPGAVPMTLAALVGRLPSGMAGLLLVTGFVQSNGSYAQAGVAAACYAVGVGVSGPLRGRAVDRRGARGVLLVAGAGQALAFLALLAALAAETPAVVPLALSFVVGALLPPIGPVMRTMWSRSLTDQGLRSAAFALESVIVDAVFIVGPSVVALLLAVSNSSVAIGVTAVFTAAGCLALAGAPAIGALRPVEGAARDWRGPLRVAGVRWMLPVGLLATGSITGVEVALLATADAQGHADLGGLLIAAFSVGSVFGGFAYGAVKLRGTSAAHLGVFLAVLAAGYAVAVAVTNLWLLAVVFAVAGVALAPMMTAQYTAMEEVAPEDAMTESFAWLNALGQGGGALAATAAGALAADGRPGGGFLVAAAMSVAAALLTLALRRPRAVSA